MITEDYCSFETAVLLKEKGFDIPCGKHYYQYGEISPYTDNVVNWNIPEDDYYSCPSQSLALKWLREIHHVEILITYGFPFINGKQLYKYFWCPVKVTDTGLEYPMDGPSVEFTEEMSDTYEEACENGIKWVLENLI